VREHGEMFDDDKRITYLARVNHRNVGTLFGIRQRDRRSHFLVIGKTGTGKSALLQTMVAQDMAHGSGLALFDPHGDLAESVRDAVPQSRRADLIYLDVPDENLTWSFNPFSHVPVERRALVAAGFIEVFKKMWPDDWGPRLEHLLRNVVFTLLERPGSSFADIPALLADKDFRKEVVDDLENREVKEFWIGEFARYSQPFRAVVVAPLQNKIGALLTDPLLRRILTADTNTLDLRNTMDTGKVLIVNLDKGRIGEGPASILGALLVSHIALAGFSRRDIPEAQRRDFHVFLDEFHSFTTLSIATMLSELRKYRVNMVLAHQYLAQLDAAIRDAIFGNVGTVISFRVGAHDAAFLAREFAPKFAAEDFISLPRFHVYLRLMIDGEMSKAFSATTLHPDTVLPN
jgi:type IV secretory pathway TraG/TraD family ATPase VirD4